MKYIRYTDEFADVWGNPVAIMDPDIKKQREVRERALAEGRRAGIPSRDISWDAAMIDESTFAQVIVSFVNGIPYGERKEGEALRSTPEEQGHAIRVIRAFQSAQDGHVRLEEKSLEWLKTLVSEHGYRVFRGTIPALISERLEDTLTAKEQAAIEERQTKASQEG